MKRFHVHLHVDDLQRSLAFYARLFAAEPTRSEADYAKWMLDDPPLNFAISTRGGHAGVDHLGIQTDDEDELAELGRRAHAADAAVLDEGETSCCYARSRKHWVTDPQGVAWEHFRTLDSIPVFGRAAAVAPVASATPVSAMPAEAAEAVASAPPSAAACCGPGRAPAAAVPGRCC